MDYFTRGSRRIQMINQVIEKLNNGSLNGTLAEIYGPDAVETQRDRYIRAVERFEELFGEGPGVHIFRAPGRTEIHLIQKRIQIQTGAAADDRQFSPLQDVINRVFGHLLIHRNGERLARVDHPDHMMRDTVHLFRRRFGAADIHVFI